MTNPAPFLPYGRQTIEDDDIAAVTTALRGDFLTTGPAVTAFEYAFAAQVGADHAIAVSSGTAALHLAIKALGLGPGDVAIVPSVTFVATANAVRYEGADVVFADVDPDTGLMRPDDFEAAIQRAGSRVSAALPVHLNGQPCDMVALSGIAASHGIDLIEDACHALGGTIRGANTVSHPIGDAQFSRTAMFSLHPVKAIAMGEGGVLTTNDPDYAAHLNTLRNHGLVREPSAYRNPDAGTAADGQPNPWYYELQELGLNYRASDIHCALGLSQLRKLDSFIDRRHALAALYDDALADLAPMLRPAPSVPWGVSGRHLYAVLIDFTALGQDRASLMRALHSHGIGTQVHYVPVHRQPYYTDLYGPQHLPGANAYYARCLSLPLFPSMTDDDVTRVADELRSLLAH